MIDIALICVPAQDLERAPAALAVLQATCKQNNKTVSIHDLNLEMHDEYGNMDLYWQNLTETDNDIKASLHNHCVTILKDNPAYIGLSVFSEYNMRSVYYICEILRKLKYNGKIVIGGNSIICKDFNLDDMHVTDRSFGAWMLDNDLCDYYITGEGEHALNELMNGNSSYPGINSSHFEQIINIDELPIPDYSGFDLHRYATQSLYITSSRGCVRNCSFCNIAAYWPKYRYRNPADIVKEMTLNKQLYGIASFEFTDSLINGSTSNFAAINKLLIEEKTNITYKGQFIVKPKNQMLPEHYALMKRGGCDLITVGIESASESVRDHMGKKFSNADIEYHLEQCAYYGIKNVFLMLTGYPTETEKDHQANLDFMEKYKFYNTIDTIYMIRWGYTMSVLSHTPMYDLQGILQIRQDSIKNLGPEYNWISDLNPSLTFKRRLERRLEVHTQAVKYNWPQPRVGNELMTIKKYAEILRDGK